MDWTQHCFRYSTFSWHHGRFWWCMRNIKRLWRCFTSFDDAFFFNAAWKPFDVAWTLFFKCQTQIFGKPFVTFCSKMKRFLWRHDNFGRFDEVMKRFSWRHENLFMTSWYFGRFSWRHENLHVTFGRNTKRFSWCHREFSWHFAGYMKSFMTSWIVFMTFAS